jgi:hypothetical protein
MGLSQVVKAVNWILKHVKHHKSGNGGGSGGGNGHPGTIALQPGQSVTIDGHTYTNSGAGVLYIPIPGYSGPGGGGTPKG